MSILERLSGPLIDEVCDVDDGTAWLAGLEAVEQQAPTTEPTHPMVLRGVRVMGGRFDEARPLLAQANEMAASRPDYFVAAVAPVFEADAAMRSALRGVQLARRSPENVMLTYALASAADVAFDRGHPDAEALLVEARGIVDRCVDPGIAGRYLARVEDRHGRANRPQVDGPGEQLTERELSALRYLPSQLSQREIASELYVSLNTVKTHCKAICRKLGVEGRTPAVQAARDNGLL